MQIVNSEDAPLKDRKVPSPFLLGLLGFYMLIAFLTTVIEDELPWAIGDQDISRNDSSSFSEESARRYLTEILGDQPRVAGTQYHYNKTLDLKVIFDGIASNSTLPVHTEWQLVNGAFWIDFSSPMVNVYQNLSNVIALLEGDSGFNSDGTTGTSILVNCHHDSVPFSIGASDDGLFCGVMAETLEKLSRRSTKLKHNVIFLANGAEENALQGSHGFLKHPWSRGVIAVVNLEAAGMNGRPSVFQVTDPRVLEAYRKTHTRPIAQGLAEFLFSSGIIPSDTDFRIWRDFGHIYGIDIAFMKQGNVYHTRNDRPELIKFGVIQNAGNMLLNFVRYIADDIRLADKQPQSTAIYFDYLGLFLVTYDNLAALLVDLIVGLLGLSTIIYFVWLIGFRWSTVWELLWSVLGRLLSMVGGIAGVAIFMGIMLVGSPQMRYLSSHWLVAPFYWIPYLVISVGVSHGFDFWRTKTNGLNPSIRTSQAMSATRLLMSSTLLILCCIPSVTNVRYLFTTPLLWMSASSVVTMSVIRQWSLKAWQHLLLETLISLPSVMFAFSIAARLNCFLIPIMGRSGLDYPDLPVAGINIALAVYFASTISGIELLFSRRWLWIVLNGVLVVCIILMFIPFSPYSDVNVTQRHYWFHTQITSYKANLAPIQSISGVQIVKVDAHNVQTALSAIRNSPLYVQDDDPIEIASQLNESATQYNETASQLKETASEHNVTLRIRESDLNILNDDCENLLHCNMPSYRPGFDRFIKGSLFVKMSPPTRFDHSLHLVRRSCASVSCTLSFEMNGPAHNTITIWLRQNITLMSWSLRTPIRKTTLVEDRPVYTIIHSTATYSDTFKPLEFTLSLTVPESLQSGELVDISHHAHKIHHPEEFTEEYRQLLRVMPEYANVATFLSYRSNYIF
ncbi:endoplasmic reticulum metallopeptidase 1-like [Pararge aegeria]|uniref:endoplasmic reticulum metallopeptidase 1-like n=1 Tax=Pararge aegeria TaxID=116150 RepID=UPI0019D2B393|nr:endoplasmic reticulum metallopeptidase 1-like [Pararge aegeria]